MGLFNGYLKEGKGVSKEDVDKKGIALYLDIFARRIWKMMSINILYIVASIPAFVIAWLLSTFAVLWAISFSEISFTETEIITGINLVALLCTVVVVQICGSGPATAGMTYVLRKYVTDKHSWVWSDFFEHFKKNFRQGICIYLINVVVSCLLLVSFLFYSHIMGGMASQFLRAAIVVFLAIFCTMQLYTYQMIVCVEIKVRDAYRNAMLLTFAKLPWNVLTMAVTYIIMHICFKLFMSVPIAGIVLFLVLYYSFISFTQIFMTNNIINKYILVPATEQEAPEDESVESISSED